MEKNSENRRASGASRPSQNQDIQLVLRKLSFLRNTNSRNTQRQQDEQPTCQSIQKHSTKPSELEDNSAKHLCSEIECTYNKENYPRGKPWRVGRVQLEPLRLAEKPLELTTVKPTIEPTPVKATPPKRRGWLKHCFYKCRASVDKYRLADSLGETNLHAAVSKFALIGQRLVITCANEQEALVNLNKNFLGNLWKLQIGGKTAATIRYDMSCASEENPRPRKLQLTVFDEDGQSTDVFTSKEPEWSSEKNRYVMNFEGRVGFASVHNCVLVNSNGEAVLIFGVDANRNNYVLDVKPPLTSLLGFALAISSVAFKLAIM